MEKMTYAQAERLVPIIDAIMPSWIYLSLLRLFAGEKVNGIWLSGMQELGYIVLESRTEKWVLTEFANEELGRVTKELETGRIG